MHDSFWSMRDAFKRLLPYLSKTLLLDIGSDSDGFVLRELLVNFG